MQPLAALRQFGFAAVLTLSTSLALAETWQVNLQNADLPAFVAEVANITGKSFVVDPRVNGKVNVVSERPLSKAEVYDLFLSVLEVNDVIAVQDGQVTRLVPSADSRNQVAPVDLRASGQTLTTRVITLKNSNVSDVYPALRPLVPSYAHIAAVPGINALVISDKANRIREIEQLVSLLDGSGSDQVEVIRLEYLDPESALEMVASLTGVSGGKTGSSRLKVIADVANNRLIIKGPPEAQAQIKSLMVKLDVQPTRRLSGLRVFRLKFADADHVANMLRGLLANQSLNSSETQSGLQLSTDLGDTGSTTSNLAQSRNTNLTRQAQSQTQSSTAAQGSGANFSIIADQTQNAIVVNAKPEVMVDIEEAIAQLDVRRAQVLIQAAIVEVSGESVDQLGVQWAVGGPDSGVGVTNFSGAGASLATLAGAAISGNTLAISNAASQVSGALFAAGGQDSSDRFYGAVLQALESTTNSNLLSMPSILTLDNEEASILVGQNVPFITGSVTTTASSVSPYQTIERQDVGINLTVVPHIGEEGTIRLEVVQEVSDVVPTASGIQTADIVTNKRAIKTTILADNEQTIALGGLMSDRASETRGAVPVLGDLPLVGSLFRARKNDGRKTNLIVFLQPTILDERGRMDELTRRRYDELRSMQLELDSSGNLNRIIR